MLRETVERLDDLGEHQLVRGAGQPESPIRPPARSEHPLARERVQDLRQVVAWKVQPLRDILHAQADVRFELGEAQRRPECVDRGLGKDHGREGLHAE